MFVGLFMCLVGGCLLCSLLACCVLRFRCVCDCLITRLRVCGRYSLILVVGLLFRCICTLVDCVV